MRLLGPASLALLLGVTIAAGAGDSPAPAAPGGGGPPAAPAAPRIAFEAKEIDFGKAVLGSVVERTFRFRNAGNAPLLVRRVKPSCGCTAALLSKAELGPGESGEILARFETAERSPAAERLEIHVFTNDPLEKDLGEPGYVSVLRLTGEVANLLDIMPFAAYFPSFRRGTSPEARISVLPRDVPAVEAVAVESSAPWIRASAALFERRGKKGFEVVVTVDPEAPLGKIDGKVVVRTDHPGQPVLAIPVIGRSHGKIVVFPERLQVLGLEGERDPVIHLMRTEGEGIAVEAVEAPPEFAFEVTEPIPGRRVEIALKLKPDAPRGPFAGAVRIFLRDAEHPLFEVPVTADVPRRVALDPPAAWLEGRGATAAIRVRGAKALKAVAPDALPLRVEIAQGGARVLVALAPGAPAGPFAGSIRLTTDAPGEEQIDVPVRGVVAEK